MFSGTRKVFLVAIFTLLIIVLVNLAWWFFYRHTEQMLDYQLSRRLMTIANAATVALPTEMVENLLLGDLNAYAEVSRILEGIRVSDSLSELFILDENYSYLVTTSLDADSTYFLSALNGSYIDSLFFGFSHRAIATPSYKTASVYLKSAFAPLYDSNGFLIAVLGVEANVDYFDDLAVLRRNLYYSSSLSIAGGLLFGFLFLLYQRKVNQAERQLFVNETHSYLGRMVAVVSHEIKNPLMIIRASAERLQKKNPSNESAFILDEIDRLNSIVTGYLDFAKAGGSVLSGDKPELIRFPELVANLRHHFQKNYPGKEIEWLGEVSPPEITFTGYVRSLRQVLLNLLLNGAEACLAAGKPIAVGITAVDKGKHVELKVIDYGSGIKKKELKQIFTPFFTTKQHGSGLGLYLSKKIITAMGGEMSIFSRAGQETEVVITLPKEPKG